MLQNFRALPYKLYRTVVVAVLALADIVATLYHYFSLGNVCPRISWAAHSSGALAGFLLGLVLFKGSKKLGPAVAHAADEEEVFDWTRVAMWVAATLLGAAVSAAVICNVLLTPPPQSGD
jgi:membrane protease YdiL (CAAX protease family)